MCKAKTYTKQLLDIYQNVQTEYKEYKTKLKRHDALQQDLLHAIENESFNAARGYALAKMIKDMRVERRETKNELETLTVLNDLFVSETMDILEDANIRIENRDKILQSSIGGSRYTQRYIDGKTVHEVEKENDVKRKKKQKELKQIFIHNANTTKGNKACILSDGGLKYCDCIILSNGYYNRQKIKKTRLLEIK